MSRTNEIAVLDIGSKKMTVLIGNKTSKGIYDIRGVGEYDYSGYASGKWYDVDGLKKAVGNAISIAEVETGIKIKKLYIGVPAEFLAVVVKEVSETYPRTIRITSSEINHLFEKGNNFDNPDFTEVNCSAVYYTLDDATRQLIEPRGMMASKLTAQLSYILCETHFIKLFDSLAEKLKLKEIEYIATPFAQAVGLLSSEQRDKSAVIIDIGYISTSVAVSRGDGLLHLSSFSLGGGHIAGDISIGLDLPFNVATDIQNKADLNLDYSDNEYHEVKVGDAVYRASAVDVNQVAFARLDDIIELIMKSLELCKFDIPSYAPYYLTGGGVTNLRGAREYISAALNKKIEILLPDLPRYNRPYYSSTIGILEIASRLKGQGKANFIKKLIAKIGG